MSPVAADGRDAVAQLWLGGSEVATTQVPLPPIGPGEILVAVRLATICGSDRHTVSGRRTSPSPSILGHEAVGEVVTMGGDVLDLAGRSLRTGDRVVWTIIVSCGACDRCESGHSAKCRSVRKIGHERFDGGWPLSGCYATHVHLPVGAHAVRIPDHVPDSVAAPAACATATVLAAARVAGPLAGKRVLISGAGMLGITATALAHWRGAREVVVTDLHAERLDLAQQFAPCRGASADGDPAELGEFDVAFEFSGSTGAVGRAVGALDVGGVAVLAGSVLPVPPVGIDPERIVRRWLTVTGVHNYEPADLLGAVEFLSITTGEYAWADLVSAPGTLDELPAMLAAGRPQQAPRLAVRP